MEISAEQIERVKELTQEAYGLWRQHPVSRMFIAFLRDQAANLREAAADMVVGGLLRPDAENPECRPDYLRGRILTLEELETLSLEAIRQFYLEGTDGTEADQGPPG